MPSRPDLVESLSIAIKGRRKLRRMERRKSHRKGTLRRGTIVYGNDRRTMNCVVLNTSDGGAWLVPADLRNCPDKFSLTIIDQPTQDCEIVWRDRDSVGVKFVQP